MQSADPAPPPPPLPRRTLIVELLVVLIVGVVSPLTGAILYLVSPTEHPGYIIDAVSTASSSLQTCAVVLYLIWRSPEGFAAFGLHPFRPVKDTLLVLALLPAAWCSHVVIWHVLWYIPGIVEIYEATTSPGGPQPVFPSDQSRSDVASIIILSLFNASAEQLVVSAYLITRLRTLFRSAPLALLLSTCLFTSYHIYQGPWALPSIFAFGLIFGAAFLATGRILPLIIAHAVFDVAVLLYI